jgi:hypothetical protein
MARAPARPHCSPYRALTAAAPPPSRNRPPQEEEKKLKEAREKMKGKK